MSHRPQRFDVVQLSLVTQRIWRSRILQKVGIYSLFITSRFTTNIGRRPNNVMELEDDEDLTLWEHMIAGAIAGMAEHSVMYPVDTIKTRMQSYMSALDKKQSIFRAVQSIIYHEGALRLWRGITAVLLSAGPAHAVYFATYEAAKEAFGGNVYVIFLIL
jgi:hypothetical protein